MSAPLLPEADLARRLAEAEATIEALLSGQVDSVVDPGTRTTLLLSKAQSALSESEKRYRHIVETTREGVWLIGADNRMTFMNRRMEEILGCEASTALGGSPLNFLVDGERDKFIDYVAGLVAAQLEVRFTRADPCLDPDLKLAEVEVTRANRALKTLSGCNEALIRATNEADLLREVCRLAVVHGGYRMAWVGYAEHDEARTISPQAHAGIEEGYLSQVAVTWSETDPKGQGPAGRAIRSASPVVCNDLTTDPSFEPNPPAGAGTRVPEPRLPSPA